MVETSADDSTGIVGGVGNVSSETGASTTEKVRNAMKAAVDKAIDPDERRKKLHELNTASLFVLLMPVALYYAVGR
jgi:hypothetical protein